jgi:UDP-N-acetylglucosamine transferase subunit ALG13
LIFVSVGTQDKPFNRLIEGVDRISEIVGEEILAQIGHSTYIPKRCEFFRFCGQKEMLSHIKNARIVISQAGFGIIGNAIMLKKPVILVPREINFGEAVDKQYELAEYLASQNKSIICVRDIKFLTEAIEKIRNVRVQYDYRTTIPTLIDKFISQTFFKGE